MRVMTTVLAAFGLLFIASAQAGTLADVRAQGTLRCGVNTGLPGFGMPVGDTWQGFDADMCRAVAAAVLGDADKVEFVAVPTEQRIASLAAGEFDLLASNLTWTLSRDTDQGISFAGINFYDGQGAMIRRDKEIYSVLELDGSKVCVQAGTTSEANLQDFFRYNQMNLTLVETQSGQENLARLEKGECDVVTGDQSALYALRTKAADPAKLKVLPEIFSKEPLSLAVKAGDAEWRKIVQWTLYALINAEELAISQTNVDQVRKLAKKPEIRRFVGVEDSVGEQLGLDAEWAYRIVKQVGNYEEIFERNIGKNSPLKIKRGLNALWREGGLLYVPPVN